MGHGNNDAFQLHPLIVEAAIHQLVPRRLDGIGQTSQTQDVELTRPHDRGKRALVRFTFDFQIRTDLRKFGNVGGIHHHINRSRGVLNNEGGTVRHHADDHALDFDRVSILRLLTFHLVDSRGGRQCGQRSAIRIRMADGILIHRGFNEFNLLAARHQQHAGTFCPVVVKAL